MTYIYEVSAFHNMSGEADPKLDDRITHSFEAADGTEALEKAKAYFRDATDGKGLFYDFAVYNTEMKVEDAIEIIKGHVNRWRKMELDEAKNRDYSSAQAYRDMAYAADALIMEIERVLY